MGGGNVLLKAVKSGPLWWHFLCGSGLPLAFWVGHNIYFVDLISNTDHTLLLLWVIQCTIVILLSSFLRKYPGKFSYLKAIGSGLLGLLSGVFVFSLGAISLGAPVGSKYMLETVYWSALMSSLTISPAAAIFGASWDDWQRIFLETRPKGSLDYMVCLPALGSIIGSWFGAWPMPLDWERSWQEWPICVTYGALIGYAIGMVVSFILVFSSYCKQGNKVD